jgi:predicted permease
MTIRDLALRVRALVAPRRVEQELDDELGFHLARETEKLMAQGLSQAEAHVRARARFGSPALSADQCRDARGVGAIDSLRQDLRFAFATFRRAPFSAVTVVVTIALGLALVAAVFTGYNAFFLRGDAVRNPDELFEVRRLPMPGRTEVWDLFVRADYDALRRDTHAFTDAAASVSSVDARFGGHPVTGTLVTANFFQVLGARPALGRVFGSGDDERQVVVLSHRGWVKLFAADRAVVGTAVTIAGESYEVAGVMPPGFSGAASLTPDYWAPLSGLGRLRPSAAGKESRVALDVIGRLQPGTSVETATAALTAWAAANPAMKPTGHYPKTIWLKPLGMNSSDAWRGLRAFAPLFVVFGLILAVACANVANLLLARGVTRQREIGIRLSLGASRRRIVRQLLTESLVLALAAAVLAFGLSGLLLRVGAYAASAMAPPDVADRIDVATFGSDWHVAVFLAAGAIMSTVIFGLMPALHATRIELVRAMRGELTPDARPGRARQSLIALQVTASSLLAISAAVFLRSAFAAANVPPTVRTEDTVLLRTISEPARAAVLRAVLDDPAVERVAASQPPAMSHGESADAALIAADSSISAVVPVAYKFASPGYFEVLDLQVLRGRTFKSTEQDEHAGVVVVEESTARRLWPGREAVGQRLRLDAVRKADSVILRPGAAVLTPASTTFVVIGVVRDATAGVGIFEMRDAGVYIPARADSPGMAFIMRVHGDPDLTGQALSDRLLKVDPAVGMVSSLRSMASRGVFLLRLASGVALALGALALVLTLSALFGVLSYLVNRRAIEIGVRMALGATPLDIVRLVLSQSVWSVGAGTLAGAGLAVVIGTVLRAMTVLSSNGSVIRVFDPAAYVFGLAAIVTACAVAASLPALRASQIDPASALRQD